MTSYLLIIAERKALAWILESGRMAFPAGRAASVASLVSGDELLLYTTRGCFHNPSDHRGRVMGRAIATSPAAALDEPIEIAGRTFAIGCTLEIQRLAPLHRGVELQPLVEELETFKDSSAWGMLLRRPLLELTPADAGLLRKSLSRVAGPPGDVLPQYLAAVPVG